MHVNKLSNFKRGWMILHCLPDGPLIRVSNVDASRIEIRGRIDARMLLIHV